MSKIFKAVGNYFVVTDTETLNEEIREKNSNISYKEYQGDIYFFSVSTGSKISVNKYNKNNILNGNDSNTIFNSLTSLKEFLDQYTSGFNKGGDNGIGVVKNNQIVVNQSNIGTTLGGVIDTKKEYFLDGYLDISTHQIDLTGGKKLNIKGYDFNTSGLYSSEDNYTMVIGGDAGDILFSGWKLSISGTGSKVFDIAAKTGNESFELIEFNYENCSSVGEVNGYRQGRESGTGRLFGGKPEMTLSGSWSGGYFITTSIVRFLESGTYSLFKAGTNFVMQSRFSSNQNIDLPAGSSFLDFSEVNLPNPSTLELVGCRVTREGVRDSNDPLITPNIQASSLSSAWSNNKGLKNTYVGGVIKVAGQVVTQISDTNLWYDILATYTASNLQHFDSPSPGQLRYLGEDTTEYQLIYNDVLASTRNNEVGVRILIYRNATSTFEEAEVQKRIIDNLQGNGRDASYFFNTVFLTLNKLDYVKKQVRNFTEPNDVTAELDSKYIVKER